MAQKLFTPRHKSAPGRTFNPKAKEGKLYDKDWEKYRTVFLETNPLCYSCGCKATVVDHLTPHKGDRFLFIQLDNHIPLCEKCHNTITGLFDAKFVVGSSIKPKLTWLSNNRLRHNVYIRVKVLPFYIREKSNSSLKEILDFK
jgi:5-methylcytosine-specific restriction endonuclease McrA